jgi:uncharacterized protein YceK
MSGHGVGQLGGFMRRMLIVAAVLGFGVSACGAVQEHIEATAPWQRQQIDAATAVIAALAAKWPCPGRR